MGEVDIGKLSMEQYLELTRGNQIRIARSTKKLRELRKSSIVGLEDPFQTMVEMEPDIAWVHRDITCAL
nr:hypothetical protein [Tanacetum cinerariifolium]